MLCGTAEPVPVAGPAPCCGVGLAAVAVRRLIASTINSGAAAAATAAISSRHPLLLPRLWKSSATGYRRRSRPPRPQQLPM
eukprot:COSAG05_NODE_650_length_8102_cov_16.263383_2_plen_81_part_00